MGSKGRFVQLLTLKSLRCFLQANLKLTARLSNVGGQAIVTLEPVDATLPLVRDGIFKLAAQTTNGTQRGEAVADTERTKTISNLMKNAAWVNRYISSHHFYGLRP